MSGAAISGRPDHRLLRPHFVKRCEERLEELGPEGREALHHGSTDPEDWEPGLREYWGAMLDIVIEEW